MKGVGEKGVWLLLFVAGLGGFLYGIDFGVIAAAMPYLKTMGVFSGSQVSFIVGAVMLGGLVASLTAGMLAECIGRRRMIAAAAALFIAAVPVVCLSTRCFWLMYLGRTLQGMSAGFMSVVMPMYLTETLPPGIRGRGTGIFQLFLGIGLVSAAAIGILIAAIFGAADAPAAQVADSAKSLAWRVNFWWTLVPVAMLFVGSMFLKESPVWLKMRMEGSLGKGNAHESNLEKRETLFQRRYVVPFVLAVLVLTFNKTIGMSSIIAYAVSLFQKAGLSGALANVGDLALKGTNLAVTLLAVTLVDRKGRTWLLKVGTMGMTVGLTLIGALFLAIEKGWVAVSPVSGFVTLASFLAMQTFYSLGPGICVWLVLSELMPARIRANGMAIALFANQFVAWGLASSFFPMVNAWGYGPVFFGFAASGLLYFATVLFIPETKGKSLEEIEHLFDSRKG